MEASLTDTVKMVMTDNPKLDPKQKKYGYYEEKQALLNEYFAIALLSPPSFPLLDTLKNWTDPLIDEKVLRVQVDEDFYFKKLDRESGLCTGSTNHLFDSSTLSPSFCGALG